MNFDPGRKRRSPLSIAAIFTAIISLILTMLTFTSTATAQEEEADTDPWTSFSDSTYTVGSKDYPTTVPFVGYNLANTNVVSRIFIPRNPTDPESGGKLLFIFKNGEDSKFLSDLRFGIKPSELEDFYNAKVNDFTLRIGGQHYNYDPSIIPYPLEIPVEYRWGTFEGQFGQAFQEQPGSANLEKNMKSDGFYFSKLVQEGDVDSNSRIWLPQSNFFILDIDVENYDSSRPITFPENTNNIDIFASENGDIAERTTTATVTEGVTTTSEVVKVTADPVTIEKNVTARETVTEEVCREEPVDPTPTIREPLVEWKDHKNPFITETITHTVKETVPGGTTTTTVTPTVTESNVVATTTSTRTVKIDCPPATDEPAIGTEVFVGDLIVHSSHTSKVLSIEGGSALDKVMYSGLTVGNEYRVDGVIMHVDENGIVTNTGITGFPTYFVSEHPTGDINVQFDFSADDAAKYAGQKLVVFERLYDVTDNENPTEPVAVHEDPNDEKQSFEVEEEKEDPAIRTVAEVQGDSPKMLPLTGGEVVDTISYTGLVPGTEYTVDGTIMHVSDNGAVDTGITSTATFTPEEASGTVDVTFTISADDAAKYAGQKLVVFENVFDKNSDRPEYPVASHEDPQDEAQSFEVEPFTPAIGTIAEVQGDNPKLLPISGGEVVDTISYTGLVPGTTYTVNGSVMHVTDSGAVETGITSEATFTPDTAEGTTEVTFTISPENAAQYAGQKLVVFEAIYDKGGDTPNDPVATHEDPNDADQSFNVEPPTPAIEVAKNDKGDDIHNVDKGTHEVTVTITNSGEEALQDFEFTDQTESGNDVIWDEADLDELASLVLAPGDTFEVKGEVAIADEAHKDTVTIDAKGVISGNPVTGDDPTTYVPNDDPTPSIDVAKNDKGDDVHNVDKGTHDVVVTFTNNGEEDLQDFTFTDKTESGNDVTWNEDDLDKLESLVLGVGDTFTVRGEVVVEDTTHRDTVTIDAKGVISGNPVTGDDPTTYVPNEDPVTPPTPSIEVAKNVKGDDSYEVDKGTHPVTVTITNDGEEDLQDFTFVDETESGNDVVWDETDLDELASLVLAPGETFTVHGTVEVDVETHKDTVTITAMGVISGETVEGDDPTTYVPNEEPVTPPTPSIEVAKNVKGDDSHTVAKGSHEVKVTITNSGDEALQDFTFADKTESGNDVVWDETDLDELASLVLAPGETFTVHGTVEVDSEIHKDTVTIDAKGVISGNPVEGDDPTTYVPSEDPVTPPTPSIEVAKNDKGNDVHKVDKGTHPVTVTVANDGEEDLQDFTFVDETTSGNDVVWNETDLDALKSLVLSPGETFTVRGTVEVDVDTHKDTVTITAKGVISGNPVEGDDPTTYVPNEDPATPPTPSIEVAKNDKGDDSHTVAKGSHEVKVTITNSGEEDLQDFTFVDETESGNDVTWNEDDLDKLKTLVLAPGETFTVHGTVKVDSDIHKDTVTITAKGAISGNPVEGDDPTTYVPSEDVPVDTPVDTPNDPQQTPTPKTPLANTGASVMIAAGLGLGLMLVAAAVLVVRRKN